MGGLKYWQFDQMLLQCPCPEGSLLSRRCAYLLPPHEDANTHLLQAIVFCPHCLFCLVLTIHSCDSSIQVDRWQRRRKHHPAKLRSYGFCVFNKGCTYPTRPPSRICSVGLLADGSATSGPQLCVPGTGTMFEFCTEILLDMFLIAFSWILFGNFFFFTP